MKIKTITKEQIAHLAIGLIAGLAWFSKGGPALAIFIAFLFFLYEFVEESKVGDELYHEIKEFTAGFVGGAITANPFILFPAFAYLLKMWIF